MSPPKRHSPGLFFLLLLLAPLSGQGTRGLPETIRKLVEKKGQAVLANGRLVGFVVGVLTRSGQQSYAFGRLSQKQKAPPSATTLYEIGSITKVFTGILLADAVLKKKVLLTTPVALLLRRGQPLPRNKDGPITLLELATHTSGLPRVLPLKNWKNWKNPYLDFDEKAVYEGLARLAKNTLETPLPTTYAYSNVGFGLLGLALTRQAKTSFEALVHQTVSKPLGLEDTTVAMTREQKKRLAPGYSNGPKPTNGWDFKALAGCGALRSTVGDLLTFLKANRTPPQGELGAALLLAQQPQKAIPGPRKPQIGLAWHLLQLAGAKAPVLWHNGGTGGYASFLALSRKEGLGVVILCNTSSPRRITALGFQILEGLLQH